MMNLKNDTNEKIGEFVTRISARIIAKTAEGANFEGDAIDEQSTCNTTVDTIAPAKKSKCETPQEHEVRMKRWGQEAAQAAKEGKLRPLHSLPKMVFMPFDTAARFRIGKYEWCEPDHRQILTWAKALALQPEEVVRRLLDGKKDDSWDGYPDDFIEGTRFLGGRLLKVNWDFTLLPLEDFQWVEGLYVTHLSFTPKSCQWPNRRTFSIPLPHLTHLACYNLRIAHLDVSKAPNLTHLWCQANEIAELDLADVPLLEQLWCSSNKIARLKVNASKLVRLHCPYNKMVELDLGYVPRLETLECFSNRISRLDLSKAPALAGIACYENRITALDIRPLLNLKSLIHDADHTHLIRRPDQNF